MVPATTYATVHAPVGHIRANEKRLMYAIPKVTSGPCRLDTLSIPSYITAISAAKNEDRRVGEE